MVDEKHIAEDVFSLMEAAEYHGDKEGIEYEASDLKIYLELVWGLLTLDQQHEFMASREVRETFDMAYGHEEVEEVDDG